MAALTLKVTPAGRAAIVNLPNTGTNAVTVTHIGVTATAFNPETLPSNLPGELKRMTTIGGVAVSGDTIHITLRDDSADTYSLRGFALYLSDGTMFALYGQAAVIMEKSSQAMLLLSVDVKFADIAATSIAFGNANFLNPPASESVAGVTQYATNAQALSGEASNRGIVASALKYVLDSRFGVGAPTVFFKGLMGLATAAAVRVSLELKSAALSEASDFAAASHDHAIANVTGLQSALDAKAAASHDHAIANVTGLQSALDSKQNSLGYTPVRQGGGAGQLANTVHIGWDGSVLLGQVDSLELGAFAFRPWVAGNFAAASHNHAIANVTGLQSALDSKAAASHNHAIANVTGLQSALDAKAAASHNHAIANVTGLQSALDAKIGTSSNATVLSVVVSNGVIARGGGSIVVRPNGLGSVVGQTTFDTSGGVTFTGNVTTPRLNASLSDDRLKTAIVDLPDCLEVVMRMRPRAWNWIDGGDYDFGWIAQEHRRVMPEAVCESDDEIGTLAVRYGKAEPYLAGAIQNLARRLAALERAAGL